MPSSHFSLHRESRRSNWRRGRRQHFSATGRRSYPQAGFGIQIEFNWLADGRLIATGPDGSLKMAPGLFIFAAGGQFSPKPNPKSGKLL
jgi:hypothetical protein